MRKGLAREDVFSVGIDVAMTESMQHCDIVLPAATHFECDDLYAAYGHHSLQRAEAALPPAAESQPNTEIFRRLAARFGFTDDCFKASDRELMNDAVDPAHPRLRGIRPSEISLTQALLMTGEDGRPLALFDNIRPGTPSGKVELASDTLAKRWGPSARLPGFRSRESEYPLRLISPASDKRISSTLLGRGGVPGEAPALMMHPDDALARRLGEARQVRVFNKLGEVILPLQLTDAIARGVVASEKGAWLATSATGQTISALVSAEDDADLAEGACYNDTPVEVEAA
jgi:anaerobic selenocysteine-containing dehydrogenase